MAEVPDYRRDEVFRLDDPNTKNAIALFFVFSRFEFALKRTKRFRTDAAKANWDKFAKCLGKDFFNNMKTSSEAAILFSEPPRKLKIDEQSESGLRFEPVNGRDNRKGAPTKCCELFVDVRCIRNNLFHGEKPYVTGRDSDLIEAALHVLDSAMAECEKDDSPLKAVAKNFQLANMDSST